MANRKAKAVVQTAEEPAQEALGAVIVHGVSGTWNCHSQRI